MNADQLAYSMTLGGAMQQPRITDADLEEVRALLEKRDIEHLQTHDHLPGAPGCPLPRRDDALPSALTGMLIERRGRVLSGESDDVAKAINARMPWMNVLVGEDEETEAERQKFADSMARLHAGRMW
jgi:hypothetical protein